MNSNNNIYLQIGLHIRRKKMFIYLENNLNFFLQGFLYILLLLLNLSI